MRTRNLLLGALLGVCFLVGLAATTSTLHTPLVCPEGITCSDATKVPLRVTGNSGHTNWLSLLENGGTNYVHISRKGNIGIGVTNIFYDKSIGITRVVDREGSNEKAWINLAGLDTWPTFNFASEWWANCGTNDGVMDLTWLSSTAIAPTKDFVWSVGAADGSTYFRYKYAGTNRYQMDVSGNITTVGSMTVGYGGTAVTKILSATATLDFADTGAQTESDLTITVTGAALGDTVCVGVPHGSTTAGSTFMGWVSAADTVTIRFSNYSSANKNPASGTFRATVVKF